MLDNINFDNDGFAGANDGMAANGEPEPLAVISNRKATLPIYDTPAVLGRNSEEVDLYFFHQSISRRHCRFDCRNGQFTVTDMGSTVGTQVNGTALQPGVPFNISSNDKLTIGKVKFVIQINYDEISRRPASEPEPEPAAEPIPEPEPEIPAAENVHVVYAKAVPSYEFDRSEIVYVSCGLEPQKKNLVYTQEFSADEINAAQAEIEAAGHTPAPAPEPYVAPAPEPYVAPAPEPYVAPAPEPYGRYTPAPEPYAPYGAGMAPAAGPARVMYLYRTDEMTGAPEQIVIDHTPFLIGRKMAINDYAINVKGVSRSHLTITQRDGSYYVTDMGSTNGTKVNGVLIPAEQEYKINEGDSIKLSDRIYTVGMMNR